MQHPIQRAALSTTVFKRLGLSLAVAAGLSACGGGGDDSPAGSTPQALGADSAASAETRSRALAAGAPAVGTLQLASSNAAGQARGGGVCAVSADASMVLFVSAASNLVAGDTNGANDVFLKNLRTGSVVRVSTGSTGTQTFGGAACLGLTPSGQHAVFSAQVVIPDPTAIYGQATELAIFVKNLATGVTSRVSPPLSTFANTESYIYSGIADDGSRVALVGAPTRTYLGGYQSVANGPARLLVAEVGNGAVVNYESQVRIDLSGDGQADSDATLLADGRRVVFTSRADHPEVGDLNQRRDLFVLELATRNLRRVPGNTAGTLVGSMPVGDRVAVSATVNGVNGLYFQNLADGVATLAMPLSNLEYFDRFNAVSGDGSRIAFLRRVNRDNRALVRTVATGAEQRVAVKTNGVVSNGYEVGALMSRDASSAAFQSVSTNLAAGVLGYQVESFVKTVGVAAGVAVR